MPRRPATCATILALRVLAWGSVIEGNSSISDAAFYNRVASKFGGYHIPHNEPIAQRFPRGAPEDAFEALVLRYTGVAARGLDVGCADGANLLALAPHFGHLTGIDLSEGMLEVARRLQQELGIANVSFEARDAAATGYPDASFEFVYSRRGPTYYAEIARLLRLGGVYVEIQIGDQDTRALKEQFGRGQDYGGWNISALSRNCNEIGVAGLEVIDAAEYTYDELYADIDHLSRFLEGVPIFTDYNPVADRANLEAYVLGHTQGEGVVLPRHRVVIAARKP